MARGRGRALAHGLLVAQAHAAGGSAAFIDAEHALDPQYAEKLGVNVEDLLIAVQQARGRPAVMVYTLVEPALRDALLGRGYTSLTPVQQTVLDADAVVVATHADQALALLAQLTDRDKQVLASEFRAETKSLDDEERAMLAGLLRQGLLPVPADLNAMLLASIDERLR